MSWGLRVSLALCLLGCATTARASYLFSSKFGDNTLDILSTLDGSATVVQNSDHSFNALTPDGQSLIEGVSLGSEHIFLFNTAANTVTDTGVAVTGLGSDTNVIGIAQAPGGGPLYAVGGSGVGGESFFAINTTTGVATNIGLSGGTVSDIAFNPTNGLLYAWVFNIGLSTINAATGVVTDVGVGDGLVDIQAIAFDSAGNLYGARNSLFLINPTDGTYSAIATLAGGFADVRVLAFADTPEPGTFGIAALGCLAIAIARRRLRMPSL